jgi:hypothetical protein
VDLIFVLAGRRYRKAYGVELLRQGRARRLLLSTLSAGSLELSRFADLELPAWPRLLALQPAVPPLGRLFFLDYDGAAWRVERLPVRPFGTLNEITQLAAWLGRHPEVRSVLLVSSASHLRRIRLCCRAILPGGVTVALAAAPPDPASRPGGAASLLVEYAKLALYGLILGRRALGWWRAGATDGGGGATSDVASRSDAEP